MSFWGDVGSFVEDAFTGLGGQQKKQIKKAAASATAPATFNGPDLTDQILRAMRHAQMQRTRTGRTRASTFGGLGNVGGANAGFTGLFPIGSGSSLLGGG